MALFKIAKGPSNKLGTLPTKATEGFAYFQPYDGSFYIDIATANAAVIARSTEENASANRIKIAAGVADKVGHTLSINGKSFNGIQNVDVGTIAVGYGGTGKTSWTKDGVIYASATNTLAQATASAGGAILITGTSATPTWLAAGTSGYVLVAKGANKAPVWTNPNTLTAKQTSKTLKFTNVKASGAAAPAANATVNFNGSADITISTQTIGALNAAGDTMVGTLYFANGTTYYVSDSGAAKFNTLEAASTLKVTGATTLSSTLTVTGTATLNGATTIDDTLTVTSTATFHDIVPATTNTYSLGSTSTTAPKRWKTLYIGDADTYGSATQPIWWSNGVPTPCTSYSNASVATAGTFTSAKSVALTGDTIGSASSKAGWSIATKTYQLSPQTDSATWRTTNTAPFDALYQKHITFDGLKTTANIGAPATGVTYSHVITIGAWSDSSGGAMHQLAFNDKCIAFRRSSSATAWGDWLNIVHSTKSTAIGAAGQPVWVDANGKITACTSYSNATVGTALKLGVNGGDATHPVYFANGVPVACENVEVPTVFKTSFIISSGATSKQISDTKITADMHVINLVITGGDEGINAPITWETADGSVTFKSTSAVTANVYGYAYLAKVVDL